MKPFRLLVVLLLAGCAVFLLWQWRDLLRERAENARLREALAQTETAAKLARETRAALEDADVGRAREDHEELLRLRGQVAQLRRQIAEAAIRKAAAANIPAPTPPAAQTNASPADTYSAAIRANVPWNTRS